MATSPPPVSQSGGANEGDGVWALVSYILFCCCCIPPIVVFFIKKDESDFIKFHSLQAIGYGLVYMVVCIILTGLQFVAELMVPGLSMIVSLASWPIGLAFWGYAIFLGIKAMQGEETEIPVIGEMVRNF